MKTKQKANAALGDSQQPALPLPENRKSKLPRQAFSIQEFADMTGLAYVTIYRLVKSGEIKVAGKNLTRKLVIPKTELDRFLEGKEAA